MIVSAIVAVASNGVIGKDNTIPWYLPADLAWFRKKTTGHHVIMGRKSFESIGKPLPKRTNIVITRDPFYLASGCLIAHSLEEALKLAKDRGETEAFIIGGGEIYQQSWPWLDKIYLTSVKTVVDGDVFFPEIDPNEWTLIERISFSADDKNVFPFSFLTFVRNDDYDSQRN